MTAAHEAFALIESLRADVRELACLSVHHADGTVVIAPLTPGWQPWPDLGGVQVYPVPHDSGKSGPFVVVCRVQPGVESLGAHLNESRLIVVLEGSLVADGQYYGPGQPLWIAPGQPMDWHTETGYLATIAYHLPPHDIDPELFRP